MSIKNNELAKIYEMVKIYESIKKKQLTESELTCDDVQTAIKKTIEKYFPNSYLRFDVSTLGPSTSLAIKFAIGKDKSEWTNGIIHNDPAYNIFWIHGAFDKTTLKVVKPLTLEASMVGFHKGKNDKLGWRDIKKECTLDKIVKTFDNYFSKLKDAYSNK
jgi:hypothetical protein